MPSQLGGCAFKNTVSASRSDTPVFCALVLRLRTMKPEPPDAM